MRNEKGSAAVVAGIVLALVIVFGIIWTTHAYYQEDHHTGCTVSEKDRTQDNNGNSHARVYTENCGVFEVGDALFKGHFNSADTYSGIKVGKTYDFTTIGWRVPFLSMFPNIIQYTAA